MAGEAFAVAEAIGVDCAGGAPLVREADVRGAVFVALARVFEHANGRVVLQTPALQRPLSQSVSCAQGSPSAPLVQVPK